ncbi:MAG: YbjN domain-containing protein [Pseudodesulfovibrio sp.]
MSGKYELVKQYLYEMELPIISEDPAEEIVVVEDQERGVSNLIIDCEEPILILEQVIMQVPSGNGDVFKRLLQMNRTLVHGAFVLDEDGRTILFRDTLQLANLDRNELEGSIQALGLALAEHSSELLTFADKN